MHEAQPSRGTQRKIDEDRIVAKQMPYENKKVRKSPGSATITNRSPSQTPRGRGNRQNQTGANQTNVRKALRIALSSPSEVIAMLKGLKNTRTKLHNVRHKANFTLSPDATLNTEIHKNSVRIKAPNSVNASKRKHKNQINHNETTDARTKNCNRKNALERSVDKLLGVGGRWVWGVGEVLRSSKLQTYDCERRA